MNEDRLTALSLAIDSTRGTLVQQYDVVARAEAYLAFLTPPPDDSLIFKVAGDHQ